MKLIETFKKFCASRAERIEKKEKQLLEMYPPAENAYSPYAAHNNPLAVKPLNNGFGGPGAWRKSLP